MSFELPRSHQLVARGGAGLVCDEDGVSLAGVALARTRLAADGARRCEVRSPEELDRLLGVAFGPQPAGVALRVHRGLRRAAAWIEAGDLGRASVEAVKLGMPELALGAIAKLEDIASFEKTGDTWEDQPRVPAGQTGGGQWTAGDLDGVAQAVVAAPPSKAPAVAHATRPPRKKPTRAQPIGRHASTTHDTASSRSAGRELLIPVSAPATAIGGYGGARPIGQSLKLPRLGRGQALSAGAQMLDALHDMAEKDQIDNAIARFGLDPRRSADVTAARAYVWSRYALSLSPDSNAPNTGPGFDAASRAVMRFALIHPEVFEARGDPKARTQIIDAANRGFADYQSESRPRPAGVAPELQTKSWRARAAIADMLRSGRMDAHHLVAPNMWRANVDVAALAYQDGWRPDSPSNLIALPRDAATQAALGETLPLHRGPHPDYDGVTGLMFLKQRAKYPHPLTAVAAHAILDEVANQNRYLLTSGWYLPRVKVAA